MVKKATLEPMVEEPVVAEIVEIAKTRKPEKEKATRQTTANLKSCCPTSNRKRSHRDKAGMGMGPLYPYGYM